MNGIKLFAKISEEYKQWEFTTIKSEWHLALKNLPWESTNHWRNRTGKSIKNQDAWGKCKLEVCRYFGSGHDKKMEMKGKGRKQYLARMRKLLDGKLSCRTLIKGINTKEFKIVQYSWPFLISAWEEHSQMYLSTRDLMGMHKSLRPCDDIDCQDVSTKEGRRGLTNVDTMTRCQHYKDQRKTNYFSQNQTDNDKLNNYKTGKLQ